MTATQAPTPGPLSDAERYEQAKSDFNRMRDDGSLPECDGCDASDRCMGVGNVCNPTAQVEASGSEREPGDYTMALADQQPFEAFPALAAHIERMAVNGRLGSHTDWNAFLHEINAALRPQPSGETRPDFTPVVGLWKDQSLSRMERVKAHRFEFNSDVSTAVETVDEEASRQALLSARPLALGGQQGEDAAWSWLNQHVECDPADRDYSADEMVDAFMAGAGRYDIWLKALERIAGEQQYRSGYCQTDITVEPALTAEEAQTVARAALSTTPARAEAQDEGAAGERGVEVDYDPTKHDGFYVRREGTSICWMKDGAFSLWVPYDPAHPSPPPAADEDRARSALTDLITWFDKPVQGERGMVWVIRAGDQGADDAVAEARAALKSTAAKEGGAA